MRKVFCLILSVLVLACAVPVYAAGTASAAVEDVSGAAGQSVAVNVNISGNPGLASWMFELSWDSSVLTLTSEPKLGSAFSDGTMLFKNNGGGKASVLWFAATNNSSNGAMFTLSFSIASTAASGNYEISVTTDASNTIDENGKPVTVKGSTGHVTVSGGSSSGSESTSGETSGGSAGGETTVGEGSSSEGSGSSAPVITTSVKFKDVAENAFYRNAVYWCAERGITGGTSADTFSPQAECSRAQMVAFLWRAAGRPEPTATVNPFIDVNNSDYYYKAVLWAVENKITSGVTATKFAPSDTVNRAQAVTFLYRYMGTPVNEASGFSDVSEGSFYAAPVAWAVRNGVTSGTAPGCFSPSSPCVRYQIVIFIYRVMSRD